MKKNTIIFYLNSLDVYSSALCRDINFNALGYFLEEACLGRTNNYVEWLKKVSTLGDETGYNYCGLRLDNQDLVSVTFDAFREGDAFAINKDKLIEILTEWNKITNMKPMPNEVHLIHDGDKVWLEIKS